MLPKHLQNTADFFSSIFEELSMFRSLYIMTVTVFITIWKWTFLNHQKDFNIIVMFIYFMIEIELKLTAMFYGRVKVIALKQV